jgi:threonyl-tRNA synthetase
VAENQPIERLEVPKEKALEMFKYNKYKVQIINEQVADGSNCVVYRCGLFIDICNGPHLPNLAMLNAFLVKNNSSSYWQGNKNNDSLQRVYGISFAEHAQLVKWQEDQEEAARRDHRNIGRAQELFFGHQWAPGSAFFLPNGAKIYNKLIELLRKEYRKRGFIEVISPNMFNNELWHKSGHDAKYSENMFNLCIDEQDYSLKPMNCPGHCLMFDHKARSYRELPLRLAEFGVVHRNEAHGALSGLTRVRRFVVDDGHIFCSADQVSLA